MGTTNNTDHDTDDDEGCGDPLCAYCWGRTPDPDFQPDDD